MQQYAVSDECMNMWIENDGVAEGLHDKLLREGRRREGLVALIPG